MSGNKELTTVASHDHVHTRVFRFGQQSQVLNLQDILATDFGVTAMRHKELIIESTENWQSLHMDVMLEYPFEIV